MDNECKALLVKLIDDVNELIEELDDWSGLRYKLNQVEGKAEQIRALLKDALEEENNG